MNSGRIFPLLLLAGSFFLTSCSVEITSSPSSSPGSTPSMSSAQNLDQYGGYQDLPVPGGATGFFRVGKLGTRWVFATPEGNAFWLRAVYVVNWIDGGDTYRNKIGAKYAGSGDGAFWIQAIRRLRSWGFNALGEYASTHALPISAYGGPPNSEKLPFIWIFNASYYGLGSSTPHKSLYKGIDTLTNPTVYLGIFPDVFDPAFTTNVDSFVSDFGGSSAAGSVFGGAANLNASPWLIGLTTDDGDYTTGFGPGPEGAASQGKTHPHLGWVAAVTAPTQASGDFTNLFGRVVTYSDTKVYTKYALRDFLQAKYGTIGAMNTAWGSTYTTFDSDGGWKVGNGFLDENGRHPWIGTDHAFLSTANPQVKADLDAFLFRIAEKYFSVYATKIRQYLPNHLVFTPATMQAGVRREILQAAGQYVDAIQSSGVPGGPTYPLYRTICDVSGKPVFVWTTLTAQADSNLTNPDLTGWGPNYNKATQALRGQAYADEIANLVQLQATNGDYCILGIDWWEWVDKVVGGENMNFGLVSRLDNAYDGKEAVVTPGTDPWGYPTGGEARDYGDFLSAVTGANNLVYNTIAGP